MVKHSKPETVAPVATDNSYEELDSASGEESPSTPADEHQFIPMPILFNAGEQNHAVMIELTVSLEGEVTAQSYFKYLKIVPRKESSSLT